MYIYKSIPFCTNEVTFNFQKYNLSSFIYNVFLGIRQSKLENFGNRIKLLSWTNLALLDANQAYNK